MNFKSVLLALGIISAPGLAMASNTIKFQGRVDTSTCSVTVNNSATALVVLPSVAASELATLGATAGETNFTIGVSDCPSDTSAKELKVGFVGNNVNAAGHLINSGTAGNVELVVSSLSNGTILNLNNWTSQVAADGITLPANSTTAERDYFVRYYATGLASVGSVAGSLQYSISYP
ncbi:fimbrial protein [Pseudomonas sp. Au-Pse12]|jgi:major type 1 subunit fimbrin (pilin)|uniref:fimbrial protein n=1 Tax=Pseudomonas sp. Au-Pse12 TaxID=2906459 RepID=UPI001E3974DF|nr:fimbrial protein [Pseudomonas sp. Au-Pse12]MCE4053917.1 type 1 fimbrial protein [Pseudomonas sp. Au-Pse12]